MLVYTKPTMKFKTTIKLITEAKDRNEATEIAGDYLSGNLTTGVRMKFRTVPVCGNRERAGIALVIALIAGFLILPLSHSKHTQHFIQNLPEDSVIQPPLKTSSADEKAAGFKKAWLTRNAQETLSSIKR